MGKARLVNLRMLNCLTVLPDLRVGVVNFGLIWKFEDSYCRGNQDLLRLVLERKNSEFQSKLIQLGYNRCDNIDIFEEAFRPWQDKISGPLSQPESRYFSASPLAINIQREKS